MFFLLTIIQKQREFFSDTGLKISPTRDKASVKNKIHRSRGDFVEQNKA